MKELLLNRYSMRLHGLMYAHGNCRTISQLRANLRLQAMYTNLIKCLNYGLH